MTYVKFYKSSLLREYKIKNRMIAHLISWLIRLLLSIQEDHGKVVFTWDRGEPRPEWTFNGMKFLQPFKPGRNPWCLISGQNDMFCQINISLTQKHTGLKFLNPVWDLLSFTWERYELRPIQDTGRNCVFPFIVKVTEMHRHLFPLRIRTTETRKSIFGDMFVFPSRFLSGNSVSRLRCVSGT